MTDFGSTQRMLTKLWWLGASAAVATCSVGCSDAQGEFDKFVERADKVGGAETGPGNDADTGECSKISQADVANGYLFTLSASISRNKPFLANATVTIDEGANTISFSVQPLDAGDKTTPVGAPIPGGPFPIEEDGSFVGDFGEVTMVGEANPISGSELATTLLLRGQPGGWCAQSTFVCGEVEGIASKPIENLDLKTSTFTFQRLENPGVYPEAVINCDGRP